LKASFLIISQVYVPDPAAVGHYIADAAAEMARRGYRTIVYTSARGYDDPSCRYPPRENLDGVEVRRLPWSSFGKSSIAVRLLAQSIFLLQAIVLGLCTRGLCGLMISTSPPFCGVAGVIIGRVRRIPVKYWLMDLNPDQMVAMKLLPERSMPVRVFDAINRSILKHAADVIVLDRFMAARLVEKLPAVGTKLQVMPPWPHEDHLESVAHSENPFRRATVPPGRFAVMYSGNHSPANPLQTLLDAAKRLESDPRLLVLCIGGGGGKRDVEDRIAAGAKNIISLPHQALNQIRFSLSAADVHVVSIGSDVVGIVHPCKVYGAMAVARPILLLGPKSSHVGDLIEQHGIGWQMTHGDVDGAVQVLREILDTPAAVLDEMGRRATAVVSASLSRHCLMNCFCDVLQRGLPVPVLKSI
jgi:colanic acid biosynthesis glycosyl transferase WcaI